MSEAQRNEVELGRMQKKLKQRDRRIAGLVRRVADLEHALSTLEMSTKRLPIEVERAVQHALCNVRMIPVLGLRCDEKIVAVQTMDKTP